MIAVRFKRSLELPMILTPHHGVRPQGPVKLHPLRYQSPAVNLSHWITIKTHHYRVMLQ